MDVELFVEKLKLLAPSKESLRKFELEEEFINDFRARFYCIPKLKTGVSFYGKNIILNLLQDYDCSKVEIGAITFLREPIEEVNFYQIGNIEADILVVNKISFKIEVLDYLNTNYVIWAVAENGSKFLIALLACAEYLVSKLNNVSVEDEASVILKKVNYCSELAGGQEYAGFYKMLLGYFE